MTDLLRELNLEIQPGDIEPIAGYHNQLADACAAHINAILLERVKDAVKVYGKGRDKITKHDRWATSHWVNIHDQTPQTTHSAYLLGVRELEGHA